MFFDDTLFGGGGEGFILTSNKLYAMGYTKNFVIDIDKIKSAELFGKAIILNGHFIMNRILEDEHVDTLFNFFKLLADFFNPSQEDISSDDLPTRTINKQITTPNKATEVETETEPLEELEQKLFTFGIYLASMNDEIDGMPLFYGHMKDVINAMSAQEINIGEILLLESTNINKLLAIKDNIKIKLAEKFKAFLNAHKFSTIKEFTTLLLQHLFDSDTVKITEIGHGLSSSTPKNSH